MVDATTPSTKSGQPQLAIQPPTLADSVSRIFPSADLTASPGAHQPAALGASHVDRLWPPTTGVQNEWRFRCAEIR